MQERNLLPIEELDYVYENEDAFLVKAPLGNVWIPKTQAIFDGAKFTINEWFALKVGLI